MPERAVPRVLAIAARLLLDESKTDPAAAIVGAALSHGADAFLTPELPSFAGMADELRARLGSEADAVLNESAGVELGDLLAEAADRLVE